MIKMYKAKTGNNRLNDRRLRFHFRRCGRALTRVSPRSMLSHLSDIFSAQVVQAALDKAMQGRTCITIAHRLATIRNADVICVLDRGTVAEMGTHDDLMLADGLYAHLLQETSIE